MCDAKWLRIGFVEPLFCSSNYYACPWALSEFFLRDVPVESLFTYIRLDLLRVYMQILLKLFSTFVMRTICLDFRLPPRSRREPHSSGLFTRRVVVLYRCFVNGLS